MPVNITDLDEFTDPVTSPSGADPANAASVLAPVQKLSNRTRHLFNKFDANGLVFASPLDIARYVGIHGAQGHSPSTGLDTWSRWNGYVQSEENVGLLRWDVTSELPQAAELVFVAVLVDPGAARSGANRMQVAIERGDHPFDIGSPSHGLVVVQTAFDDASGALQWIVCTPGSPVDISTGETWQVAVAAGNDAASNKDKVYGLYLRYAVSSLRNA